MFREAREVQQILRERGFTITHDWTQGLEEGIPERLSDSEAATIAELCISGVENAEFSVFLFNPFVETKGTWVELGAALGWRQHCIILLPEYYPSKGDDVNALVQMESMWLRWLHRAVFLRHAQCHRAVSHTDLHRAIEEIASSLLAKKAPDNASAPLPAVAPAVAKSKAKSKRGA